MASERGRTSGRSVSSSKSQRSVRYALSPISVARALLSQNSSESSTSPSQDDTSTMSLFGNVLGGAQKPAGTPGLFGSVPPSTGQSTPSLFGGAQSGANNTGAFGQQQNTPPKLTLNGSTMGSSQFGAQASSNNNAQQSSGGLFGGLGGSGAAQQPAKPSGGLFGNLNSSAPTSTSQPAASGGGLFGGLGGAAATPQPAPASGGSLFGGFGASNNNANAQTQGNTGILGNAGQGQDFVLPTHNPTLTLLQLNPNKVNRTARPNLFTSTISSSAARRDRATSRASVWVSLVNFLACSSDWATFRRRSAV